MAILLPLLAFLFVIGVDFARVYKHTLTLMNCARSGALYGSNSPTRAADTATIQEIALADAGDLNPKPTVKVKLFDLEDGTSHIEVTVSAPFKTVTNAASANHCGDTPMRASYTDWRRRRTLDFTA